MASRADSADISREHGENTVTSAVDGAGIMLFNAGFEACSTRFEASGDPSGVDAKWTCAVWLSPRSPF